MCVCVCADVDSEKEGAGTDSGISSVGEPVKTQISEGGKGFNVPEIEFQEYKVGTHFAQKKLTKFSHFCLHMQHEPQAIDSYRAQGDGQVSFEEGDVIQVLDKIEDGESFRTLSPQNEEAFHCGCLVQQRQLSMVSNLNLKFSLCDHFPT